MTDYGQNYGIDTTGRRQCSRHYNFTTRHELIKPRNLLHLSPFTFLEEPLPPRVLRERIDSKGGGTQSPAEHFKLVWSDLLCVPDCSLGIA